MLANERATLKKKLRNKKLANDEISKKAEQKKIQIQIQIQILFLN